MTRYVTEHRNDPERVIAFCRKYCKVFNEDNKGLLEIYFTNENRRGVRDKNPYIVVEDDCDRPFVTGDITEGKYIMFMEEEGVVEL